MARMLRRQKSAYALSFLLCLAGLAAILMILWRAWPQISSTENQLSAFGAFLWGEQLDFIPGIEFKLAYLLILGVVMLISGATIWTLSRQWFYLPGETILFQCSFCKKRWRSRRDKGLVQCPHCRQIVHPKMVEQRVP